MNTASSNHEFPPELEARLVALILDEASDVEREELTQLMEQQPLVASRFAELTQVHDFMENANEEDILDSSDGKEEAWKLAPEKRRQLLSVFAGTAQHTAIRPVDRATQPDVSRTASLTPARRKARQRFKMLAFGLGVASCVGGLAAMPYYYLDSRRPLMGGTAMVFNIQRESTTAEASRNPATATKERAIAPSRFGNAFFADADVAADSVQLHNAFVDNNSDGIVSDLQKGLVDSGPINRLYRQSQSVPSGLRNRAEEAATLQRQLSERLDPTGTQDMLIREQGFIDTLTDVDRSSIPHSQGLARGSQANASASSREFEGESLDGFGEPQTSQGIGGLVANSPTAPSSNDELGYAMPSAPQISNGALAAIIPDFESPPKSEIQLQIPDQLEDQLALGLEFQSSGNDAYDALEYKKIDSAGRDFRYLSPPAPAPFFDTIESGRTADFGTAAPTTAAPTTADDMANFSGGAAFGAGEMLGQQQSAEQAISGGGYYGGRRAGEPRSSPSGRDSSGANPVVSSSRESREKERLFEDVTSWDEQSSRRATSHSRGLNELAAPEFSSPRLPEAMKRLPANKSGEVDRPEEVVRFDASDGESAMELPAEKTRYQDQDGDAAGTILGGKVQENVPTVNWMFLDDNARTVDLPVEIQELALLREPASTAVDSIAKDLDLETASIEPDAESLLSLNDASTQWNGFISPTPDAGIELQKRRSVRQSKLSQLSDETDARAESFSTFSLHVGDVSFKLAQAALAKGEWPNKAQVRIEEFVNAFDYGDPVPSRSEKIACQTEQCIHPFMQQRNMLRIAMRTSAAGRASQTPLRLTLLLDNSGSMERSDRKQTVRRAFEALASQLTPADHVTLISFARSPRLLADGVSGEQAQQLASLIDQLPSEGGTNVELALNLAAEKAKEHFQAGAQNRVILLTDGAVNLGDANPEKLASIVVAMRDSGLAFDAAGISADGLNDEVLETLTRQGDGRYYLLDSAESVDQGFARQIAGALRPSAKNVKVQVEFNPHRVGRYKLLGFEKHELKQEDFRNDSVDAAEMAAAEAGVAMYQIEALPDGEGDVGSVSVRFRDLETGQMVENRWPIPYIADPSRLEHSTASIQLATTAAMLAAKLRADPIAEAVDLKTLAGIKSKLPAQWRTTQRVEQLEQMIEQTRQLVRK